MRSKEEYNKKSNFYVWMGITALIISCFSSSSIFMFLLAMFYYILSRLETIEMLTIYGKDKE